MKIIVLGDSLASPRSDDGIKQELRWPGLLSSSLICSNLVNLSKGYSTTERVRELAGLDADLLIVQLGIVDCAPRLLSRVESSIISRLPPYLGRKILNYYKLSRVQAVSRAYVDINRFRCNIEKLKKTGVFSEVFLMEILPAGKKFIAKNPLVAGQICSYNDVIQSVANENDRFHFIPTICSNEVDSYTLDDGYHLNESGHVKIMEAVLTKICSTFNTQKVR